MRVFASGVLFVAVLTAFVLSGTWADEPNKKKSDKRPDDGPGMQMPAPTKASTSAGPNASGRRGQPAPPLGPKKSPTGKPPVKPKLSAAEQRDRMREQNLVTKSVKTLPWSYRPLTKPAVPEVKGAAWVRDDIDRFVLAGIESAKLQPNPDADRYTLLRRLAFDLTGLPPTEDEITVFVNDRASDDEALAKVVDAYLASPRFGESWARHWLDVARYADSVGNIWNAPFTYAWRYRDYVIDAFNQDKPFDRFILEQVAGDLLPAKTIDEQRTNIIATGFLTLGAFDLTEGSEETVAMDRADEQVDVTSRAFMGLTVACARCHDHKYEPILSRDYYAMAGVFYSSMTLAGTPQRGQGAGYVDADELVALPIAAGGAPSPAGGVHSMDDFGEAGRETKQPRYTLDPNVAMAVLDSELKDCAIAIKGDPYERGFAPPRGDVKIPALGRIAPVPPDTSGRLELARWIATPTHPLTTRVAVNRVWQHLFGRGIVTSVDDFGATGENPTHPELLDHLARRFIDEGWSVKKLIRAIVLSRTYRLSSAASTACEAIDPQNNKYWRMPMRRLEMEPMRDAMLAVSGRLTFERPEGIPLAGVGGKGNNGRTKSLLEIDEPYRTVYLPVLRSLLPRMYDQFDFPDPSQIRGCREVTTVAPQALFLMNSDFMESIACRAAERLLKEPAPNDRARIELAHLRCYGRRAETDECDAALSLVAGLQPTSGTRDETMYRWTALMQAMMASAEFRYLK